VKLERSVRYSTAELGTWVASRVTRNTAEIAARAERG